MEVLTFREATVADSAKALGVANEDAAIFVDKQHAVLYRDVTAEAISAAKLAIRISSDNRPKQQIDKTVELLNLLFPEMLLGDQLKGDIESCYARYKDNKVSARMQELKKNDRFMKLVTAIMADNPAGVNPLEIDRMLVSFNKEIEATPAEDEIYLVKRK